MLKPAVGAEKPSQAQAQPYKTVLNQRSSNTAVSCLCNRVGLKVHCTPVGTCWELLVVTRSPDKTLQLVIVKWQSHLTVLWCPAQACILCQVPD